LACQETREAEARQHADEDADRDQAQPLPKNHCQDVAALGAERHANSDLMGLQRDGVGHYAKYADEHEREADSRECAYGDQTKLRPRVGFLGQ